MAVQIVAHAERAYSLRFYYLLARLLIGDRLDCSKMSETSPGAPGLLADYRDATFVNETPA